jgi:hypothetical protein
MSVKALSNMTNSVNFQVADKYLIFTRLKGDNVYVTFTSL